MSPEATRTILVLEGGTFLPSREVLDEWNVVDVEGPLEAAAALAREVPALIVVHPRTRWHRQFVAGLPESSRPAVLAVGEGSVDFAWVDEWMAEGATAEEVSARIRLARARAAQRQLESSARLLSQRPINHMERRNPHPALQ